MRLDQVTKCAAGAMLFGGTLGMAGTANAGALSWGSPTFSLMYVGSGGVYANTSGETNLFNGSWITQSAATASGLSVTGSNVTGGYQLNVSSFNYSFFRNSPTAIVISGLAPSGGTLGGSFQSGVYAELYSPTGQLVWQQNSSGGSYSSGVLNLGPGTYTLQGGLFAAANSGYSGTMLEIAVVPAPGAIALLGAARLVGTRRRR